MNIDVAIRTTQRARWCVPLALMSGSGLRLEIVVVDRDSINETRQAEANLRGRIDA